MRGRDAGALFDRRHDMHRTSDVQFEDFDWIDDFSHETSPGAADVATRFDQLIAAAEERGQVQWDAMSESYVPGPRALPEDEDAWADDATVARLLTGWVRAYRQQTDHRCRLSDSYGDRR